MLNLDEDFDLEGLLALAGDATAPAEKRELAQLVLDARYSIMEANPLEGFHPHSRAQRAFLAAVTAIIAAFAGNRFGKTTILVVRALIELCDEQAVPEHLRKYKTRSGMVHGRIVVPDLTATLEGVLIPALRMWAPKSQLRGGAFDKAWDKQRRILYLANGNWLQAMTYEMDLDKFGGAALDFIGYDEPPPKDIRRECLMRLVDRGGFEMFAMTPLMGIGWLYRDIWKQREHPDITVIQGSIHDNPTLDQKAKARVIGGFAEDDPERRSREFGEFAHFGGMVYSGGFEHALVEPPSPEQVKQWDIVVGIDPGLRNAALIYVGFDEDQRACVFDEVLLQDRTPADYAKALEATNQKWGIESPLYVIDPSARNRSLTNRESVQSELTRLGVPTVPGQNDVQGGVQHIRRRLQHDMLKVSRDCRGLRDESEEYRVEDRPDGEFKVVKENDHRLDALRYAVQQRPWFLGDEERPRERLGFTPDWEPAYRPQPDWSDSPPLGAMS